ncbi:hypothetical protein JYK14_11810 [Siccirubricoccus sp. KC 17139]|uniref:Uncharacterized protein n=1 Tax=Siccirubricoccus soli TaxID=2899147 RepID=A0ABT1D4I6_9PROT|nr:hypothetical protein [Siccirubricoccus soli]MCO6416840.1 hypothetical protein [Siccirubricoccus soli]MCP2682975.1 hypothetical protein [Siccirubricoccus soli]
MGQETIRIVLEDMLADEGLPADYAQLKPGHVPKLKKVCRRFMEICFGTGTSLPLTFFDQYLGGSGNVFTISTEDLLKEDSAARLRVEGEITRRALLFGSDPSHRRRGNIAFLDFRGQLNIKQRNYSTVKWWGALGSFFINYFATQGDWQTGAVRVKIVGGDTYRWDPNNYDRPTVCFHQLCARLEELGGAKQFPIYGTPAERLLPCWLPTLMPLDLSSEVESSGQVVSKVISNVKENYTWGAGTARARAFLKSLTD